ncbi:glycosyltransferase family 2 protein [Vibrio sp. 10N.222.54.B11]|uniref:glycosyltransferase family 2 protein n=1 Tax=Vibrio sp. 10N.222.54.B11 TaxID=3229635 RepID=UPI0035537B18
MKLTIITVNYNDSDNLDKTLDNIKSQSIDTFELIVVDGGSKDNSLDVVDKYCDIVSTLISEPDTGIYNAMNKGIKLATGDYVIFMNAGDSFVDENTLANIEQEMSDNPGFDIYYSDAIYVKATSEHIHHAEHSLIMSKMPFNHQSAVINRCLHDDILYNEEYRISSDYDFFLRAHKKDAKFHKIETKIARHSLDGISVTSPFHSCLESVHSHVMNYKSIKFDETEYYGEFFIKEVFKKKPLLARAVVALYSMFIKGNKKTMLKSLVRKVLR